MIPIRSTTAGRPCGAPGSSHDLIVETEKHLTRRGHVAQKPQLTGGGLRGALIAASAAVLQACGTTHANRQPVGDNLPSVSGSDLEGNQHTFPNDIENEPAILLVGYKQNAQFDIDRWMLGLDQLGVEVPVYELPTVVGMLPGMFASRIDNGMRSGIPRELWAAVVTLYDDDAERLAKFLGNERPNNARVLLVRPDGAIAFFHDRGYGIPYLRELAVRVQAEQRPTHEPTTARLP
jgi:hypothetical protein